MSYRNGKFVNSTIETLDINNPLTNELIVRGTEMMQAYFIWYDALGNSYNLSLTSSTENTFKFNTINLAAGMYIITVNNKTLKFIKL